MSHTVGHALRAWVRAARGALEWHLETGEAVIGVPEGFRPPALGAFAGAPRSAPVRPAGPPPEPAANLPSAAALARFEDATPTSAPATRAEAPAPPPPIPAGDGAAPRAATLQVLRDTIGDCTRCPLSAGRAELVFGWGSPTARIAFVGDGPGPAEDALGVPFVGESGALLGRMIRAMGLRREDAYLCYVTKCRAPDGDVPDVAVEACAPFVRAQLAQVRPEIVVALGDLPTHVLVDPKASLSRVRGQFFEKDGLRVLPTFHPDALLQSPNLKVAVWEDLKKVMRALGLEAPRRAKGRR